MNGPHNYRNLAFVAANNIIVDGAQRNSRYALIAACARVPVRGFLGASAMRTHLYITFLAPINLVPESFGRVFGEAANVLTVDCSGEIWLLETVALFENLEDPCSIMKTDERTLNYKHSPA
jgi:hypothetical protein